MRVTAVPARRDAGTIAAWSSAIPPSGSTLIPSLRYDDAHAAINWLERVLGFARYAIFPGPNGTVAHAELRHGSGMVMLGSATNPAPNPGLQQTPREAGGHITSGLYLIVPDCGPAWERARAAGAEVMMELQEMSYGGRAFAVRDPEGYVWSFGEYDPWAAGERLESAAAASKEA